MEYAKHQMQNNARFGRYCYSFVLLGLDTFVNLLDIKHDTLHQTMENIEQEVAQTNKQDWLNPAPDTPPVADQEVLLLKIQESLEELILNHGSMSAVLKLLYLLMKEAIKRLSHTNTDHVTVTLTANIISIPGVSSMLHLLGFRFQPLAAHPPEIGDRTFQLASEQAAMGDVSNCSTLPSSHAHPVAVIFPHWNPDRLLGAAQQAIAALIDLSACSRCVNALIWILPLTCDVLEQLISLLEKCRSSPTVCPRLTEKGVAALWNQPHLRDFLQVIGYEQAGLYLFHNPRDLNKSLLLGSLSLFLALRPQPLHRIVLSKLDPRQYSSASVREQQSRQGPQETAADTVRGKKTRRGPQESSTGTMRDSKARQGPQESLADTVRNKETRQGAPEASGASDKQSEHGAQETAPDSKRTAYPSGNSNVHLNTLKPLLVLRHQIMMQAPWLTVTPTSEEVRVKHSLVQSLNSLHSQQKAHIHCMELWHKKALMELVRKPEKRENKRQECFPKKVKVKGPTTPSTAHLPLDAPVPVSQNVVLRATAQEIIKEQEEKVRHRHRAAVKDLFLPFIDPLL